MTKPMWRKSSFSGPDANCVEIAFGAWRKSSFTYDSNCVEIAFGTWGKSSLSGEDANCVEIAHAPEVAAIRDSKNVGGPYLVVPTAAYRTLIARAGGR